MMILETQKQDKIKLKPEKIWYVLLTEESYYRNCKFINHFCLKLLNRSINECIVESEVSSMTKIQTGGRPIKAENSEKLNFIASNGPHPLVSSYLVDGMLTNYFGKDWHFTITNSKWCISKTIDRLFSKCLRFT